MLEVKKSMLVRRFAFSQFHDFAFAREKKSRALISRRDFFLQNGEYEKKQTEISGIFKICATVLTTFSLPLFIKRFIRVFFPENPK